jgi:hypothetical protein
METVMHGSMEPVKIKLEKNTKGFNYEISVSGESVDSILAIIADAKAKLEKEYGVA